MKKKIFASVAGFCITFLLQAQPENAKSYSNFPIVVTLQFHAVALPFRDIKANFSNIGLGLGTEVSYNGKQNWSQQMSVLWYRNRAVGNGILVHTQAAWRPSIASAVYTEVKAGVGYLFAFRPVESFKPINGEWISVGTKGKGMLTLPLGVSIGCNTWMSGTNISPFISYQFMVVNNYNKSIPIVPQTLVQIGSRIHME